MTNQVVSFSQTVLFKSAAEISAPRVSHVLGLVRKSIEGRRAYEIKVRAGNPTNDENGLSKDFRFVEALNDRDVALFMLLNGISPEPYINGAAMTDAEIEKKSGIASEARTRNLKGYDKMRGAARYFLNGGKMQSVLKTVVACSIVAHKLHTVLPRNTCEKFIDGLNRSNLSPELLDAIAEVEQSGVLRTTLAGGGAPTQFSQCSLQLATMKAAKVHPNGRFKDFSLDLDSPVIESFAQRFGMVADLEAARRNVARAAA